MGHENPSQETQLLTALQLVMFIQFSFLALDLSVPNTDCSPYRRQNGILVKEIQSMSHGEPINETKLFATLRLVTNLHS